MLATSRRSRPQGGVSSDGMGRQVVCRPESGLTGWYVPLDAERPAALESSEDRATGHRGTLQRVSLARKVDDGRPGCTTADTALQTSANVRIAKRQARPMPQAHGPSPNRPACREKAHRPPGGFPAAKASPQSTCHQVRPGAGLLLTSQPTLTRARTAVHSKPSRDRVSSVGSPSPSAQPIAS